MLNYLGEKPDSLKYQYELKNWIEWIKDWGNFYENISVLGCMMNESVQRIFFYILDDYKLNLWFYLTIYGKKDLNDWDMEQIVKEEVYMEIKNINNLNNSFDFIKHNETIILKTFTEVRTYLEKYKYLIEEYNLKIQNKKIDWNIELNTNSLSKQVIQYWKTFWINLDKTFKSLSSYEQHLKNIENKDLSIYIVSHACSFNQVIKYFYEQKKCFNHRRGPEDIKFVKASGSKEHKESVLAMQINSENQLPQFESFIYANILEPYVLENKRSYTRKKLAGLYEKSHLNFRLNFNLNSLKNTKHKLSIIDSMSLRNLDGLLDINHLKEILALQIVYRGAKPVSWNMYAWESQEDLTDLAIEVIAEWLNWKNLINIEVSIKNSFFELQYVNKDALMRLNQFLKDLNKIGIKEKIFFLNEKTDYTEKDFYNHLEKYWQGGYNFKEEEKYYLWKYERKDLINAYQGIVYENAYFIIQVTENKLISVYKKDKKNKVCIWSWINQWRKLKIPMINIINNISVKIDNNIIEMKKIKNFLTIIDEYLIK